MSKTKKKVDIHIKARDDASKQFKKAGGAVSSFAATVKQAAAAAAVYFSGRAILGFARSSVELAGAQFKADEMLAVTLAGLGDASRATYEDLNQFADELQRVTLYGDEANQEMMTLGLNMGVATSHIKDATRGATGLAAIFGNLNRETAMRGVALAMQGEYTLLNRYIPALRSATEQADKMAALQETMARGFDQATRAAETGLGPLIQYRNVVADTKELIGLALLPVLQRWATEGKEYLLDNQDAIQTWAENTAAYVDYVRGVFLDLVTFIRNDWQSGLKLGLDAATVLIDGFVDVASVAMAEVWRRAWDIATSDTIPPATGWMSPAGDMSGDPKRFFKGYEPPPPDPAQGQFIVEIRNALATFVRSFKDVIPPELADPLAARKAKLAADLEAANKDSAWTQGGYKSGVNNRGGRGWKFQDWEPAAALIKALTGVGTGGGRNAYEARFLERAPGQDPAWQTVNHLRRLVELINQEKEYLRKIVEQTKAKANWTGGGGVVLLPAPGI